ncbi:MAG: peptide ABC transporter substrate-binding protein [Phycisphaeraceae bacterium]|nr:peptide ABC transporter substrate-binding protein [Phycisphaeraceae bacterium]
MRLLLPVILLVAALIGVVALDRPKPRAEFVFVNSVDAFTLDPQRMTFQHDIRFARALYEMLVAIDPQGKLVPAAAERWEVSDDALTWTFHLHPEGRWSNGDPVRAGDFLYAWRRLLLPDTAADYTGFLFVIDGAEAFFNWRSEQLAEWNRRRNAGEQVESADALWQRALDHFAETVGIFAPDDRTLVVRLARPTHYWLDLCAFPSLGPVHPPTVERFTRIDPERGALVQEPGWTKAGQLVSNGPYILVEWRYKRNLRLERNPHFRDPSQAISESIDAIPIESATTAVLAFKSGAADWLPELLVEYRAEMVAAGRRDVHVVPSFGTDFFSFNCRPSLASGRTNPFADARVRRAFALTVDRQVLVDQVTRLNEPVSNVLVPRGSIDGYHSPEGLGFDPERARRELAEAGWIDRNGDGFVQDAEGRRFPTVDLLYTSTSPRYRDLSLALRDMWRRHLGVQVEPRGLESRLYKDALRQGNFMIARGGWYGDYWDPLTWLDLNRTGDGNNVRGFSNDRFDALLAEAAEERDPARRLGILSEAERILVEEELPKVPICTMVTIYLYDPERVSGITHHSGLKQYLGRIRVDRSGAEGRGELQAAGARE